MPSNAPVAVNSATTTQSMPIDYEIVLLLAGRHADRLRISPYEDEGDYDSAFSTAAIGAAGGVAIIEACDTSVTIHEAMHCGAEMALAVLRNPLGDLKNEASQIYARFGATIRACAKDRQSEANGSPRRKKTAAK